MIKTFKDLSKDEWLELRTKDVTSTEVSALFDCSPYMTSFELWHRKKSGDVVSLDPSERMKWGTRLQDSIAYGIAEDRGWNVRRMDEYIRNEDIRAGSSFDFLIGDGDALLEIKNVDSMQFKDGWIVDGDDIEAPPHIELQVQHQMLVSGVGRAHIGALIGGNRVVVSERTADHEIQESIAEKIIDFWDSIDKGLAPEPNLERDASAIIRLLNHAEPGKIVSAPLEMFEDADRYRILGDLIKPLEKEREMLKAKILMEIGDAEKVLGDGYTITAGVVGPARIEYDRDAYRSFRISWKKVNT